MNVIPFTINELISVYSIHTLVHDQSDRWMSPTSNFIADLRPRSQSQQYLGSSFRSQSESSATDDADSPFMGEQVVVIVQSD